MKAKHQENGNVKMKNSVPTTVCDCGRAKKASKQTCNLCSFYEYTRGTGETIPTNVCACGNPKDVGALCCDACDKALHYYLDFRTKYEGLDKAKFLKAMRKSHGIGVAGKCSLCDGNYIFGGNNPQPAIDDYDARCCKKCEVAVVGPARANHIRKYGKAY